jgi:regulatory protein
VPDRAGSGRAVPDRAARLRASLGDPSDRAPSDPPSHGAPPAAPLDARGASSGRRSSDAPRDVRSDRAAPDGAPPGALPDANGAPSPRRTPGAPPDARSDRASSDGAPPGALPDVRPSARDADAPDPAAAARTIALRRLSTAAQTRHQLAEALRRRGVPDEAADQVLDRFEEVGLVDDAAFADAWVQSRHHGRGLARGALAHELRRRGVAEPTVESAISGLDRDEELATARALVRRRAPATAGLEPPARARRLVGLLARKGYPPGLALRVVREVLDDESLDAFESAADDVPC